LPDLEEVASEQVLRSWRYVGVAGLKWVELVHEQNIGSHALDGLGVVSDLAPKHVVDSRTGQVRHEVPGSAAVERGIEGCEPYVRSWWCGRSDGGRKSQHGKRRYE
jgi:hypothetical protein